MELADVLAIAARAYNTVALVWFTMWDYKLAI